MNSLGAKTLTMVLLIEKWDVLTTLIISRSTLWMTIALSEKSSKTYLYVVTGTELSEGHRVILPPFLLVSTFLSLLHYQSFLGTSQFTPSAIFHHQPFSTVSNYTLLAIVTECCWGGVRRPESARAILGEARTQSTHISTIPTCIEV
jgi:hypothetical protein